MEKKKKFTWSKSSRDECRNNCRNCMCTIDLGLFPFCLGVMLRLIKVIGCPRLNTKNFFVY